MDYQLRTEIWKGNKKQSDEKLSELIEWFAKKKNTDEQVNKMEIGKMKSQNQNNPQQMKH